MEDINDDFRTLLGAIRDKGSKTGKGPTCSLCMKPSFRGWKISNQDMKLAVAHGFDPTEYEMLLNVLPVPKDRKGEDLISIDYFVNLLDADIDDWYVCDDCNRIVMGFSTKDVVLSRKKGKKE